MTLTIVRVLAVLAAANAPVWLPSPTSVLVCKYSTLHKFLITLYDIQCIYAHVQLRYIVSVT
jgi:hypothetical protein